MISPILSIANASLITLRGESMYSNDWFIIKWNRWVGTMIYTLLCYRFSFSSYIHIYIHIFIFITLDYMEANGNAKRCIQITLLLSEIVFRIDRIGKLNHSIIDMRAYFLRHTNSIFMRYFSNSYNTNILTYLSYHKLCIKYWNVHNFTQ